MVGIYGTYLGVVYFSLKYFLGSNLVAWNLVSSSYRRDWRISGYFTCPFAWLFVSLSLSIYFDNYLSFYFGNREGAYSSGACAAGLFTVV